MTLIPFALREADQELVDVHEVPRGRKSGCICPSCKTPLTARQGDVNEWHFAHATKAVNDKTEKECEYSFPVSVRLMLHQLLQGQLDITLPSYEDTIEEHSTLTGRQLTHTFPITESKTVTVTNVQSDTQFEGTSVDAVANVGDYTIVFYCTYQGRSVPWSLVPPHHEKCGVVAIELCETLALFQEKKSKETTYKDVLIEFLKEGTEFKRWVYHPRYDKCLKAAQSALHAQVSEHNADYQLLFSGQEEVSDNQRYAEFVDFLHGPQRKVTSTKCIFYCEECGECWEGDSHRYCPNCKTYLYTKVLEE
ncbi:competence protein CoiA family protein [Thaumasiovibrio subtropicus]|uniref:competence protein CoiA family protein n=1 Tax=Thaumasiovibrio subtropicus TaxID=1891207 RepID=UPI000B3515BE|nr:competence protein CoiA family protein [Thaumasiovibrio subtropicus]